MLATCSFGSANTGATVAYKLTGGSYSTSGVSELESGSGIYGVTVADADLAGKTIYWRLGSGAPYKYAAESFATYFAGTLTSAYDAAKSAASQTSVNAIPTTPLLAANYTAPDNAGITAIKAKTDNLPASPAAVGSAMTLTSAYDAAKTAAKAGDSMIASNFVAAPTASDNATAAAAAILATPANKLATDASGNVVATVDKTGLATSASLAAVKTVVDAIDTSTLATAASLAAVKADTGAVKTKTDSLTFTTPNKVDASATVDTTGIATSASLAAVKTVSDNIYSKVDTEVALLATSASLAAVKTVVDAIDTSGLATAASLAAVKTVADAVKAKTDTIPANPAAVGSAMTLTSAYDAAKSAASSTALSAVATDTSLSRKILTNKTVDTATKVTVYEDDSVSVAGSYTWTEASGTRSKLS